MPIVELRYRQEVLPFDIHSQPWDGSAEVVALENGPYRILSSLSSDGSIATFRQESDSSGADRDIGMLRLDGSGDAEMLLDSAFNEHSGMLSPDDRWLACVSDESRGDEVYVRKFPSLDGRRRRAALVSRRKGALLSQRR